jgi:hypothetical protein
MQNVERTNNRQIRMNVLNLSLIPRHEKQTAFLACFQLPRFLACSPIPGSAKIGFD